jgi:hypothetical protein
MRKGVTVLQKQCEAAVRQRPFPIPPTPHAFGLSMSVYERRTDIPDPLADVR